MKIGIDIGGSHVGIGLVDNNGKILCKKESDLKETDFLQMETVLIKRIRQGIKEILKEKNRKLEEIESIGIASPGTVINGVIVQSVNLGLVNFPIIEKLKQDITIPIFLMNDAKCAAICEKEYGVLRPYKNSVFLTIGTGIGGAVIWNKRLLEPKKYPGFEIGHMVIRAEGKKCKCGKKGCLETYASIVALKNEIIQEFAIKRELNGQELHEWIHKNVANPKLNKILYHYIKNLSIGISNMINIFEPEAIGIGGSFTYYEDLFLTPLKEMIIKEKQLFNKQEPNIILAIAKNDAGIIGASQIEE